MNDLLTVRSAVLSLLEKARGDKYVPNYVTYSLRRHYAQESEERLGGTSGNHLAS